MPAVSSRCLLVLCLITISFATASAGTEDLGRIDFPNSGPEEAQEAFVRGVLLLHSFEYEDAREAFVQARAIAPGFAMAYWGEAMTFNHPLWRRQDRAAALEALNRFAPSAGERRERTPTERERGYLRAVEVLFGEGDKVARDFAYEQAMGKLARQYPGDLEAASFHALSILGTAQGERDARVYMRAAAVVEEVFDANPRHPGAIHYLIHSYDDPVHAPLGLRPARVYAEIAPAASHAQHMISHIYIALGGWEETVAANIKSFAVSEERARRKGLPSHERNHHALHWLAYAYLQQGRYRDARERLAIMEQDAREAARKDNLSYFARMRANYILQTGHVDDAPAPLDTSSIGVSAAAADALASGWAALRRGDKGQARETLTRMKARREAASARTSDTPRDITEALVMEKELEALVAREEARNAEALELLRAAASLEESLPFDFGPPGIVKPSHELLGEMLLEAGRTEEARRQFEIALDRAPRRSASLLGLARASSRLGRADSAREAYRDLGASWADADEGIAGLDEVRRAAKEAR